MNYVLLVRAPAESWVIWAWAESDSEEGFLRAEMARMKHYGYEAKIYAEWQ